MKWALSKIAAFLFAASIPCVASLTFDGSADEVDVPDSAALDLTGDMTICMWLKSSDWMQDALLLRKYQGGGGFFGYGIWFDGTGSEHFGFFSNGTGGWRYSSEGPPKTNAWFHFAMKATSSGGVDFFYDGVLVNNGGTYTAPTAGNQPLTIGGANGSQYFGGSIDDPRLYSRGLSDAEIANIANSYGLDTITNGLVNQWEFTDPTWGPTIANGTTVRSVNGSGGDDGTLQGPVNLGETILRHSRPVTM